jgi:hypothetical protein
MLTNCKRTGSMNVKTATPATRPSVVPTFFTSPSKVLAISSIAALKMIRLV